MTSLDWGEESVRDSGNRPQYIRTGQRWKRHVRRGLCPPASDDFLIGPSLGDVGIESHEDVQVVIHDGEPTDGHGEDIRKFFEPPLDP